MIRCPECKAKMTTYCTKYKKGKKLRYYSCVVCGKKITTLVKEKEIIIKKWGSAKTPPTTLMYPALLSYFYYIIPFYKIQMKWEDFNMVTTYEQLQNLINKYGKETKVIEAFKREKEIEGV